MDVMIGNDWEWPRRVRQSKRLSNGAIVVVVERQGPNGATRETFYYTTAASWLSSIVEPREPGPPEPD
jgi:hypothetical protein